METNQADQKLKDAMHQIMDKVTPLLGIMPVVNNFKNIALQNPYLTEEELKKINTEFEKAETQFKDKEEKLANIRKNA